MTPYSEYKTTEYDWLGKIPSAWRWVFLSQICHEQEDKNVDNKESNVLSLSYGQIIRKKKINMGLSPKDYGTYQIVENGNIILRLTDLQNDHKSLRTGLVRERGIISSAYVCLRPKENPAFLQYLLHSYDTQKFFYGLGGGVRQSIGFNDIRYVKIPFPSRHEQDQIVRYLDWKVSQINKLINAKQRQIELLKEQRKKIIDNAICNVISRKHRFNHLFSLNTGLAITKSDLKTEGIPCVNYGEIHSKYGFEVNPNINALKCVDESYLKTSPKSLLQYGDFIFADTSEDITGSGNFTYLNSHNQIFAGYHTIIARSNNPINYRYYAYYFDSNYFRSQIQSQVNGVKVYSITQPILKRSLVQIPEEKEQEEIVSELDKKCFNIDHLIAHLFQGPDLFNDYRIRLISDVVTGKLDIRNVVVPEFETVEETIDEIIMDDNENEEAEE